MDFFACINNGARFNCSIVPAVKVHRQQADVKP